MPAAEVVQGRETAVVAITEIKASLWQLGFGSQKASCNNTPGTGEGTNQQ